MFEIEIEDNIFTFQIDTNWIHFYIRSYSIYKCSEIELQLFDALVFNPFIFNIHLSSRQLEFSFYSFKRECKLIYILNIERFKAISKIVDNHLSYKLGNLLLLYKKYKRI